MLLVCGLSDWPFDIQGERRVGPAPPSYGSVYPCIQNILLACRALGLGATLTTAHRGFESRVHAEFGISDEYGVVAMIPIGYPAREVRPGDPSAAGRGGEPGALGKFPAGRVAARGSRRKTQARPAEATPWPSTDWILNKQMHRLRPSSS